MKELEQAYKQMTVSPEDYRKADVIIQTVCDEFRLKIGQIRSNTRRSDIVFPRQVAMYLMRWRTNLTLRTIGIYFGKDHATVSYSLQKLETLCSVYPDTNETVESLTKIVDYKLNL